MLSTIEVAGLLHVSPRAIQKNIHLGKYKGVVIDRNKRYNIPLSALPEDIQRQYISKHALASLAAPDTHAVGSNSLVEGRGFSISSPALINQTMQDQSTRLSIATPPGDVSPAKRVESSWPVSATPDMTPEKGKAIALARYDLLTAVKNNRFVSSASHGTFCQTDQEWLNIYNTGLLLPHIFDILGTVSIDSVYRWNRKLNGANDWRPLVPEWNREASEPNITLQEKHYFKKIWLHPSKHKVGEAIGSTKAVLKKHNIPSPSSYSTFYRWAARFKKKHYDVYVLLREGQKSLREKVIFSIKRDTSKLEVGDVFVGDAHRMNCYVTNKGKRRRPTCVVFYDWKSGNVAGFEISLEETTQAVTAALRNAILYLGKIPKIIYLDNGKALKNKALGKGVGFDESGITGQFAKLGIEVVFARPYGARSKIVERFFKELTKFERLVNSFCGTSIEDKPAWLLRNEPFHKEHHKDDIPSMSDLTKMLASWLKEYWEIQPSRVTGKTIGELFREGQGPGVNADELDELMMFEEYKTIGPRGISFLGANYYSDALYGLRENGNIRYSLHDLSSIKVYDSQGRFLCIAKRFMKNGTNPMAARLGSAKDLEEVKHLLAKQRSLEKQTIKAAREYLPRGEELPPWFDLVPLPPRTIQAIEEMKPALPKPEECKIPDYMLEASVPAIQTWADEPDQGQLSGEVKEARPLFRSEREKYEWLCKNPQHQTEQDKTFIEEFANTLAYRTGVEFFERQNKMIAAEGSVD